MRKAEVMGFFDGLTYLPRKNKIIILAVLAAVILVTAVVCIVFANSRYTATSMRLLRVEGSVKVFDTNGKDKFVRNHARFQSGETITTLSNGLASIGLDEDKIVTLQPSSSAEFKKQNKRLELKLTKGALFFEVTKPLNSDESFDIKTSTMTAGIRGTSGYVFFDEEGRDSIIVTDGSVIITATNPETGETKYAEVCAGEKLTVYLYSDREENTVSFEIENVVEENIPALPLKMITENEELLNIRILL